MDKQTQIEQIHTAIAGLEAQRSLLGEAIVIPALESLREKLAALQAQALLEERPLEERRIVTILFSDIVGSTAIAEKLDPEDWRDIVAQVHAMAGMAATQHGGRVVQYLGDGLLALFGAQGSSEGDPENAIRAGLAIQAGLAALQGALHPGQALHMRVGIHTGWVVLGELGSPARREYTASGDAMNTAARLQSAAPPGGVLISHDTYRLVRGMFDLTPQPLLAVKGKREPIQTYLVRREKPRPFRAINRGVSGLETGTVGREAELEQLRCAYQRTVDDRSLVWAQLVGEPGIGKSRLLNDMLDHIALRSEEIGLLKARAYPGDEAHTFALIRRMWFDRFQISEDLPLAEAEARWRQNFLELAMAGEPATREPDRLEEAAYALGLMLGFAFASSPTAESLRQDPVHLKERAFAASRDLLAFVRSQRNVVVLLEDLHWADPASWEYLVEVSLGGVQPGGYLVETAQDRQGLFILATARPEWSPPATLRDHPGYVQIDLTALPEAACKELAGQLLRKVADVPAEVIQQVVARSEGVPYYAEEMINWYLDQGVIDQSGEPWRFVVSRLPEYTPPATLQHLLLTRFHSLPDAEQAVLQRGAVFGRHFWEGGLDFLGAPASRRLLVDLEPRHFVDREAQSTLHGETEWSFHHNLLHQVIYESALKRQRKRWHRQAAAWLEGQARQAGRLDEFVEVLGEHAERAEEHTAAADWYVRAGERARERGAPGAARAYFDRALQFAPPADLERRWRILLGRDEVLSILGDAPARMADDAALLSLAQELGDEVRLAEALYRQGCFVQNQGDDLAALRAFDAGLQYARRAGNRPLEAQLLGVTVVSLARLGELESADQAAQAALAASQELAGDSPETQRLRAGVLINVSHSYLAAGDYARAAQIFEQQWSIQARLGNLREQLSSLTNLGYVSVLLGRFADGIDHLEKAVALAERIGARRDGAYNRLNLGLAYSRRGESQAARAVLEQGLADLAAVGDLFGQACGQFYLALTLEGQARRKGAGRPAGPVFAEAAAAFRRLNALSYAAEALAGLACSALSAGDLAAAGQAAAQVWEYLQEHGAQGMEFPMRAYLACGKVFWALGEPAQARQAVEQGCQELARRANQISDPAWRAAFLENIAEHQQILEMRSTLAGDG